MPRIDDMAEDLGRNDMATYTGRSIVLFREQAGEDERGMDNRMKAVLRNSAGLQAIASSLDFGIESFSMAQAEGAGAITLPRLGMAVMPTPLAESMSLMSSKAGIAGAVPYPDPGVEAVIAEKYDYLLAQPAPRPIRVKGDGRAALAAEELDFKLDPSAIRRLARMLRLLSDVSEALKDSDVVQERGARGETFVDNAEGTWGLHATGVTASRYSGRGVRVAVIDTGLDIAHPDFAGRSITRQLFAPPGTRADPTNTHGTHCVGTACGARTPTSGPRYGIAYEAEIYALKVFDDAQRPGARRGDVLTAMDFANRAGCKVLSLSLGSATNGAIDPEYARAISRLRRAGSLTVAAAGNEGELGYQVGAPASSPEAVAVAAVDETLQRASFSCRGAIDIAAPGERVLSSVMGGGTRALRGTSMATPHVAGIAALWLQANPGWTVDQLETEMRRAARRLSQSAADVGVGLVQAP